VIKTRSLAIIAWLLLVTLKPCLAGEAPLPDISGASVGMPVEVKDLVLPGSELEPIPLLDDADVVIRVDAVYPHGTAHRYDLTIYGLEPGEHDLRDELQRKDGSPLGELPPLVFQVTSLLPPGQIKPHLPQESKLPWVGGYHYIMAGAVLLWFVGLYLLIGKKKKKIVATSDAETQRPVSLADRIRPLVTAAVAGKAEPNKLAELERALVSYWRRRLDLQEVSPQAALMKLKQHREAGPLLTQLETWLHKPTGAAGVDVAALLEPYHNMAADELDSPEVDNIGKVSNATKQEAAR